MGRKIAREILYQLIFEYQFLKSVNDSTLELMLLDGSLSENDRKYVKKCYDKITKSYDALVGEIAGYTKDFKIDRVYKSDLAALLIAFHEIKEEDDIPSAVAVNEAVSLVKKFSTGKSYSFVNGVLAGYLKDN